MYINMTTKLISLNEFRSNLSNIWKTAKKKNEKYIVMVHSKPVLEVRPVKEKDFTKDFLEAISDVWKSEEVQKTKEVAIEYSEQGRKKLFEYGEKGLELVKKYKAKLTK